MNQAEFLAELQQVRLEYGSGEYLPKIPKTITDSELVTSTGDDPYEVLIESYKFLLENGRTDQLQPYLFPFYFNYEPGLVEVYFVNLEPGAKVKYVRQQFGRSTAYTSGGDVGPLRVLALINEEDGDFLYLGNDEDYEVLAEEFVPMKGEYEEVYDHTLSLDDAIMNDLPTQHVEDLIKTGGVPSTKSILKLYFCGNKQLLDVIFSNDYPRNEYVLDIAIRTGQTPVVRHLLSEGIRPLKAVLSYDCKNNTYEATPLSTGKPSNNEMYEAYFETAQINATQKGYIHTLKVLHEYDAYLMLNPYIIHSDQEAATSIYAAAEYGQVHILEWLHSLGYKFDILYNAIRDITNHFHTSSMNLKASPEAFYELFMFYLEVMTPTQKQLDMLRLSEVFVSFQYNDMYEEMRELLKLGFTPSQNDIDTFFIHDLQDLNMLLDFNLLPSEEAVLDVWERGTPEVFEWFLEHGILPPETYSRRKVKNKDKKIALLDAYNISVPKFQQPRRSPSRSPRS